MTELEQDFYFWSLKPIAELSEKTCLVMNEQTNEVLVRKKIDPESVPLFQKLVKIRHPGLASVLEVVKSDDKVYAFTEYVPGKSLESFITEGKIYDTSEAVAIASALCESLNTLHQNGIIHRDVTANNVILSADGTVKLIDFGISRLTKKNSVKDTQILGTVGYAAPEQFGFAQTDARTDIYAVGVLLNKMLTGKMPGERIAPGYLGDVVRKCTAIDANERYKNMQTLLHALTGNGDPPTFSQRLDYFVTHLPGLRTQFVWISILSVLVYLFVLFMSGLFIVMAWRINFWRGIMQTLNHLVLGSLDYVIMFNPFGRRDKIPIFRKSGKTTRAILIVFSSIAISLISLVLTCFFCA